MGGFFPDSIDRYFADISDLPLLSAEDEKKLAHEIRDRERAWRDGLLRVPASAAALAELWSGYRSAGRKCTRLLSSIAEDREKTREEQARRVLDGLEEAVARRRRDVSLKSSKSLALSDARRKGKLERLYLEARVLEDVQHRLEESLDDHARRVGQPRAEARAGLEQALSLFGEYRQKREFFANCNVKLVIYIAKAYVGRGLPLEDLIQNGNLGLLRAIEKFDPDRGVRFSSYASFWIKQAVSRSVEIQSRVVRTPTSLGPRLRSLSREDARRVASGDAELTLTQKSERLGMDPEDFQNLTSAYQPTVSLDHSPFEDGEPLVQFLVAEDDELLQYLEQRERCERVHKLLDRLDARERLIVERRFGLRGGPPETLEAIGCDLGLSRERIRQLESTAVERLRESDKASGAR